MALKRSGLGKNLSALLSSTQTNFETSQTSRTSVREDQDSLYSKVVELPLSSLIPGKYQPRSTFDDTTLKELSNSIKQQGLLQPILVRKLTQDTQNRYEIIAGERRFRASQLAGLIHVPVLLREVDDETAMAMALVENLQREDLNPMDQARAMARLSNEFSLSHQEIAQILSKSRASVSNFLRLLSLSHEVMILVEKGELDMGHARALLSLDHTQQMQAAKAVIAQNLSVRSTENLVTRMKNPTDSGKLTQKAPHYPFEIQVKIQELAELLQAKIKLKPAGLGKGALMIHYDSLQSLETLVSHITRS